MGPPKSAPWEEFTGYISRSTAGEELNIVVEREGAILNFTLIPEINQDTGQTIIGVPQ